LKIVHRDIKPKNILIFVPSAEDDDDAHYIIRPRMKLADFGLCKILNQQTSKEELGESSSSGSKCLVEDSVECRLLQTKLSGGDKGCFTNTSLTNPRGTLGWMAPELFKEERLDYFKVDIWALGCIFAYTLTWGKHPFGDDPDKRMDRIIKKEPMVLVQEDLNVLRLLSPTKRSEAFDLIKSMLDVNPTSRPSVGEILGNPFFSIALSVSYIIYYITIKYLKTYFKYEYRRIQSINYWKHVNYSERQ